MRGAFKSDKTGLVVDPTTKFIEKINQHKPIDFIKNHDPEKGKRHREQRARKLMKWHADLMTSGAVLKHREQIAIARSKGISNEIGTK